MTDPYSRDGKIWSAIYGCWMGKNCGGTLGAPVEKAFGTPELFDIWWYPKLQEGGIPNDDLELQLLWLLALEAVGPELDAMKLIEFWQDHVGYNWDEYGFAKANLQLGMLPPVNGAYNNWFRDCMGCPIRSEIWACIAPGHPRIAAKYAYEDAIVDHAGGESVHGELFNTAIEAAAFVVTDQHKLLDIGMSYVGAETLTAKAIRAARDAYKAGVDWKEARERVMRATPHTAAQYSPLNMGFQVVGWLWGNDFGDAICKAVNCGYDTDCTAATVGSILGILLGRDGIPQKWIEPLGEVIATNESWGGLRHASTGPNPVPAELTNLTDRVVAVARRVMAYYGIYGDPTANVKEADLYADASIAEMIARSPMTTRHNLGAVQLQIDYGDSPAVVPMKTKTLRTRIVNPRPDPVTGEVELRAPAAFAGPPSQPFNVSARGEQVLDWPIPVPDGPSLPQVNRFDFFLHAKNRPAMPTAPAILVGASKIRYCGPFDSKGLSDQAALDQPFPPELGEGKFRLNAKVESAAAEKSLQFPDAAPAASAVPSPSSSTSSPATPVIIPGPADRPGQWTDAYILDNDLQLGQVFNRPGVLYVQAFVRADRAFVGRVAVGFNCPTKVWFNGRAVAETARYRPIRPTHESSADGLPVPSAEVPFVKGWNEILIKFVRNQSAPPFEAHLVLTEGKLMAGLTDYCRTHFPWEAK